MRLFDGHFDGHEVVKSQQPSLLRTPGYQMGLMEETLVEMSKTRHSNGKNRKFTLLFINGNSKLVVSGSTLGNKE